MKNPYEVGFNRALANCDRNQEPVHRWHPVIAPSLGLSLADVLCFQPGWWAPTATAKAVLGIAVALRFAHGLRLVHGAVKAGNVLFDAAGNGGSGTVFGGRAGVDGGLLRFSRPSFRDRGRLD
jgi:hypothetical protein